MQRIIVVMDHDRADVPAIDFACYLGRTTQSDLLGIFIQEASLELTPEIEFDHPYLTDTARRKRVQEIKMDEDQTIRYFLDECRIKQVHAEALVDKGSPLEEVAFESRFADLLVIGPKTSYKGFGKLPSDFVRQVLAQSECPVVITPHVFSRVEEVVFCCDGSASAVFAMKQFAYLFPQFSHLKATVLEIREGVEPNDDEGHTRARLWLQDHYHTVEFHHLGGTVKDELFTYFLNKQNQFVVMGAYGRSLLSRLLRPSNAATVLETIDLPMFIAHH